MKATSLPGGSVKIVDSHIFPASVTIAAAEVTVEPGAMRELHWHPTQDEWSYFLYVPSLHRRVSVLMAVAARATRELLFSLPKALPEPSTSSPVTLVRHATLRSEVLRLTCLQDMFVELMATTSRTSATPRCGTWKSSRLTPSKTSA